MSVYRYIPITYSRIKELHICEIGLIYVMDELDEIVFIPAGLSL